MEADARDAGPMEFRVLGPVEARLDGAVVSVGGPRQRALLGLLLVNAGGPIDTDRLIDLLWAGEPPDAAEVTLRSYVSRLRGALGAHAPVTATSAGYVIEVAPDRIDARRFEMLVREAEAARRSRNPRQVAAKARQALALWRGRAFGELATEGAFRIAAERLEALRLHALELRVEADLELGATGELVEELEALVAEHPYREAFWRHLMVALYRAERQADALAAYHRARTALDDQLGVEPGDALQALEAAILRHEVPDAIAPEYRHNLPAPLTTFVGRVAELDRVDAAFVEARLVTLVGVGGVGKTRLAIEAARRRLEAMPDGVSFVDLSPIVDPELVAGLIGNVMGIREQSGQPPVERLAAQLRDATTLIVLDNCEHLRDAAAAVADRLLRECPRLNILATSREMLGVPGEMALSVAPLGLPAGSTVEAIRESEAVGLFLARARAVRSDIADDDVTLEAAARICVELDGLPLAIELAAARARVLAPDEIAERLRDRFRFLVAWRRLSVARHRTLREAMDWSFDLLDPQARLLLGELSVFSGGFTLEAVAAICHDGDESRALDGLERLVDASLVVVDPVGEPTRYRLLETVRAYGAEHLSVSGEAEAVRERHADYFARLAEAAWATIRSSADSSSLHRVDADRENLRAALVWSHETGAWDRALRIAEAVWWAWWIWGELRQGRAWLELALANVSDDGSAIVARAHMGAAGLAWAQGDYDAAERWATLARNAFAALGEHILEGSSLNTLGLVALGRSRSELGERILAGASLGAIGVTDQGTSRYDHAVELFQASLAAFRSPSVEPGAADRNIAVTIDNLGWAAFEAGDMVLAKARYLEARTLNEARGDREGVAMNELHLATVAAASNDIDAAKALLLRALPVYRDNQFLQYAAECLESATLITNALGRHRDTARLLGAAEAMRERSGSPPVPFLRALRSQQAAVIRAAIGDDAFERELEAGRRMPPLDAMRWTLDILGS